MNPEPIVTLIAVVSEDGFISRGQGVPWDLPADKAHFRSYTVGKTLLLGRATYEEMLGWFTPQHEVYVLTRSTPPLPGSGIAVRSVQEALRLAKRSAVPELVVCGGGQCYFEAIPFAHQLMLTEVKDKLFTGIPFPPWDEQEWQSTLALQHPADSQHAHDLTFRVMQRCTPAAARDISAVPAALPSRLQPLLQPLSTPELKGATRGGYFQR